MNTKVTNYAPITDSQDLREFLKEQDIEFIKLKKGAMHILVAYNSLEDLFDLGMNYEWWLKYGAVDSIFTKSKKRKK